MMKSKQLQQYLAMTALGLVCLAGPAMAADKKPVKASAQEIALSATLKEREAAVVAKEKELALKEEELAKLSQQVDEKYTKLIALQQEVKTQLEDLNKERDQRFRNLIKIYSNMSASKVAPLLDKMEDADAVEILRAMKAEEVAKIMPKLDQNKAVRLSMRLGLL